MQELSYAGCNSDLMLCCGPKEPTLPDHSRSLVWSACVLCDGSMRTQRLCVFFS